jgi:hypothetical protein
MRGLVGATILVVLLGSCGHHTSDASPPPERLASSNQLLDSKFCGSCHQEQYDEWSGSMHAYASDDPIFRSLNAQLQKEVPPEQRGFCMTCHAPVAVRMGKPFDVTALDASPELKGVTCVFCHSVTGVHGTNNNPLDFDTRDPPVMGAAIPDPVEPVVHRAEYRTWLDGTQDNQSGMCGPCHDIVTPGGAHIERTFNEWSHSKFGVGGQTKTSCAACHMPGRDGRAALTPNAPPRKVHDHSMVGVDLALVQFPAKDVQKSKVQAFLDGAIDARLCVRPQGAGATITVSLRNQHVGHAWPSGSNQDRRAWVEVTADAAGKEILHSGNVPDGTSVDSVQDPNIFVLRDHDTNASGQEDELFWRAVNLTSHQLPAATASDTDPRGTWVDATYPANVIPDRVTMALHIRPVDGGLLRVAQQVGGLDLGSLDPVPTFTLAKTQLEWTPDKNVPCVGEE